MASAKPEEWIDPRVPVTMKAVNWDALLKIACRQLGVRQAQWGQQKSGGYNLVRFLRLDDAKKTTVVVRVPLHPDRGMTRQRMEAYCNRIASEVATMQFVETRTKIPVPRVFAYSDKPDDNGVRSPFIIMSKVHGVSLYSVWKDMRDDKRDLVLRQVVDILLELASHRFDKIGALFKRKVDGKDTWNIKPLSYVTDPGDSKCALAVSNTTYSNGADYWLAYANANLRNISEDDFGSESKMHDYAQAWFLQSLIPALYDPKLDASGFLLVPGDFHSQNIMITDVDSRPRITAVIDWEFSSTACTATFAQYPLFIVDHPMWPSNHPLRRRNVRDQAAFYKMMYDAERKRDPTGRLSLSRTFANCRGFYLFEQCLTQPSMFSELYPQLFEYIYGDDEDFSGEYYWALMEHGILKKETRQFQEEEKVWHEARSVLGSELKDKEFTRTEFIALANRRMDRFRGGKVQKWLESLR